jgi:hypothetical protein
VPEQAAILACYQLQQVCHTARKLITIWLLPGINVLLDIPFSRIEAQGPLPMWPSAIADLLCQGAKLSTGAVHQILRPGGHFGVLHRRARDPIQGRQAGQKILQDSNACTQHPDLLITEPGKVCRRR